MKTVAVTGGFDPVHVGHVRMFREARKLGDKLVVILSNDNLLRAKKGFVFMVQEERKEILEEFASVDEVILTKHEHGTDDMSVCNELEELKPDIYANGGDRTADNIPEFNLCKKFGIQMVFDVGGDKVQSSSGLVDKALEKK